MSYNYKDWICKNSGVTSVVPDSSLSVQEIIKRFTRGQSLPCLVRSQDDDPNLTDEEMMSLEPVDDWQLRQLVIELEEDLENSRAGKAARQQASEAIGKAAVKANEAREISPDHVSETNEVQVTESQQVAN